MIDKAHRPTPDREIGELVTELRDEALWVQGHQGNIRGAVAMDKAATALETQAADIARLLEALEPFAALRADDGDTFASYPPEVIIRCETSAGEIQAARAAIAAATRKH